MEGGRAVLVDRLGQVQERLRLRSLAEDPTSNSGAGLWREAGAGDVLLVTHRCSEHVGRTLEQIAGQRDPWDVLCDLIAADPASMMVITLMDEDDVRTIMADPLIAIGSDNGAPVGMSHPRTWGCFPHLLGRYVRELGVVSMEEAVRKMTSASACQFRLMGRGELSPGAIGDICAFDPATVGHDGTYLSPDIAPTGIVHVLMAGQSVVSDGKFCGERRGRVLRGGL
jgi:N-acyl-D-aspartate/D-glutamate deacylase